MGIMATDELLSTADVATRYDVAERTVQSWIAGGLLPARRIGGVYVVFGQDLAGFAPPKQGRPRNQERIRDESKVYLSY